MWFWKRDAFDALEERAVEEIQRAAWVDIRTVGRALFTLRDRVLPHGLPLALALVALNTAVGGSYGDYAVATLVGEGGYYFTGILALAYASACLEWHDREQGHQARYGRPDDANPR